MSYSNIVFLLHGFLGNPKNLEKIKAEFDLIGKSTIVYVLQDNAGEKSLDGLEICSTRAVAEIARFLISLGRSPRTVSFIGHSWGGLLLRMVCSKLNWSALELTPKMLITMQTPHMGICTTDLLYNLTQHWIVTRSDSLSVKEMQLNDADTLQNCMLYKMAMPEFSSSLSRFPTKIHISVHEDYVVRACSAAMGQSMNYVGSSINQNGWAVLSSDFPGLSSELQSDMRPPFSHHELSANNSYPGMIACETCMCTVPIVLRRMVQNNIAPGWNTIWLGTCMKSQILAHLFTIDVTPTGEDIPTRFAPTLVGIFNYVMDKSKK